MSEISKEYFCNGHIQPLTFLMLEIGALSDEERELILTHMQSCDSCMQAYLESLTDESLIAPSENWESNILQMVDVESTKKREHKILAIQFVKLGVAVCLTMVLMFGGVFDFMENMDINEGKPPISYSQIKPRESILIQLSDKFNESFNEFASIVNNATFDKENKNSRNKYDANVNDNKNINKNNNL